MPSSQLDWSAQASGIPSSVNAATVSERGCIPSKMPCWRSGLRKARWHNCRPCLVVGDFAPKLSDNRAWADTPLRVQNSARLILRSSAPAFLVSAGTAPWPMIDLKSERQTGSTFFSRAVAIALSAVAKLAAAASRNFFTRSIRASRAASVASSASCLARSVQPVWRRRLVSTASVTATSDGGSSFCRVSRSVAKPTN